LPTRAEIEMRIKEILSAQLEIAPDLLSANGPDAILIGRGVGLDSVEALALASSIETEFGIQFDDEDLTVDRFGDLASLTELVARRLSNKKEAGDS
jgi:acyl carrier protein